VYSTCTSSPWAEAIPSHEHLQPAAVCDTATDDTKKEANCNDWQQAAGPCTYTMVLFLYLHFCSVPVLAFLSRIPLLRRDRDGSRELENRNSCRQWPNGSLLLVVARQRVRFAGVWWLVLICSERKVLLAASW
jgi:hypothetical protein